MYVCERTMDLNFTTGIPEIDRLTGNKIGNGSFLLLSGNDDEGIASFSAEIEKSNGRTAEKEPLEKSGCMFLKITPENRHYWKEMCSRTFESKMMHIEKTVPDINQTANQNENETVAENLSKMIIFIDNLSELFQNEKCNEKYIIRYEKCRIISFMKEIKEDINPQRREHPKYEEIQ